MRVRSSRGPRAVFAPSGTRRARRRTPCACAYAWAWVSKLRTSHGPSGGRGNQIRACYQARFELLTRPTAPRSCAARRCLRAKARAKRMMRTARWALCRATAGRSWTTPSARGSMLDHGHGRRHATSRAMPRSSRAVRAMATRGARSGPAAASARGIWRSCCPPARPRASARLPGRL